MLKRPGEHHGIRSKPKEHGRQPNQADLDRLAQLIIKKPDSNWRQLAYRGKIQAIKMLEEAGFDVSKLNVD